jgi:hydroxyacylglutathione hydrolase
MYSLCVGELYVTFSSQLDKLDDSTLVYPGHDYLSNNLRFTLDREPDNEAARDLLERYDAQDPNDALVTTLDTERRVNTFFRLQNPTVIARLQASFPDLGDAPTPKAVFLKLRELRNRW